MSRVYFLFLFSVCVFSSSAFSFCEVVDDAGERLQLKNPAKRIISLAPDLTENLFAIGAGKSLVGVIEGSNYPEAAKRIAVVGSYSGLDLERVLALSPDLIVTWSGNFSRQLTLLKKAGVPIYVARPRQLQDMPTLMKNLGCLAGTKTIADKQAQDFLNALEHLGKRYQTTQTLSCFINWVIIL